MCGSWLKWVAKDTPYDPKWIMDFGVHKGKEIGKLPTDYLLYMANEGANGSRKKWFRTAYVERHAAFLMKVRNIIDTYIDELEAADSMGVLPQLFQVEQRFHSKYPKVTQGEFYDYLRNALELTATGELLSDYAVCLRNGLVWFIKS